MYLHPISCIDPQVDVTLPAAFSTGAKDAGVRHMSLLTAIGANASANIQSWWAKLLGTSAGGPFYAYCKGSIENTVAGLGFESTAAFRPAALLGASLSHALCVCLSSPS